MTDDVHEFQESLAFSHSQADQPWWDTVYQRAFPDMVATVDLRKDGWHQRAGRDRAIVLSSGRTVYVDEKVRKGSWDDILLEIWSQYPKDGAPPYPPVEGAKPGWAREPKDCDWIAYAFVPTHTCHLYPFLAIRAALEGQKRAWVQQAQEKSQGFRWVRAENRRYCTINIAVPIWVLEGAIAHAMTIDWEAQRVA